MSLVTITVNEQKFEVDASKMLIEELLRVGVSVPHFCYHEALGVDGNCRMCMVEIKGQKRPQISCNTPITANMEVSTTSKMIQEVKRDILELELINHPVDCPICDQAGECSLQEYYMEVGLHESRVDIAHKTKKAKHVDLGSHVMLDQERCVLCTRCTRFTQNITKTGDLVIASRGNHACVTTFEDQGLKANGYAMNVVDLCPVGALTSKDLRFNQRVWFLQSDASICHGCSKGCNIYIDHNAPKYEEDTIYRLRPRINHKVNGHFICDVGRLSYKAYNDTLTTPLLRQEEVSMQEAIEQLLEALSVHKMNTVALISPSMSLENLASIKLFCHEHHIPLYAAEEASHKSDFADDMLKQADTASNRNGTVLLKLHTNTKEMLKALESASLVLNFANLTLSDPAKSIYFIWHALENLALQIPIAPFTQQSGTLINHDMIMQRFHSTIRRKTPILAVHELLALITKETHYADLDHLYDYMTTFDKRLAALSKPLPAQGFALGALDE